MPDRVVLDSSALNDLLESPTGPVAVDLLKRVVRVESAAIRMCAVDTGRLRSSITHQIERDYQGLVGVVGTDVEYAPYVEFGTSRMSAQPFLRPALGAAT